jgi:hypothetical protein
MSAQKQTARADKRSYGASIIKQKCQENFKENRERVELVVVVLVTNDSNKSKKQDYVMVAVVMLVVNLVVCLLDAAVE